MGEKERQTKEERGAAIRIFNRKNVSLKRAFFIERTTTSCIMGLRKTGASCTTAATTQHCVTLNNAKHGQFRTTYALFMAALAVSRFA